MGGDHGYLGLVLTNPGYASIQPTPQPFRAPAYSAALNIVAGADPVVALSMKEQHAEAKRQYYERKNVEKALQRHIQDAIEEKYLESLINNRNTGKEQRDSRT